MHLKDAVFIRLQSAHGPICLWDNYPTYSMYCTLMHRSEERRVGKEC